MMRSMYSGVAGLKTHQTKMDVIGNNIANVNTVAYKSQSVTFSELMYQTTQSASGPNATTGTGGINARQIGLGVKSGAINTNISTQGASQTTNNPFDIQITGEAFFVVSNGSENFFTRDGSFYVDGAGNLAMTSNGYNVMGWGVDPETMDIKPDTVQPLRIMSPENLTYPPESTTKAYLSGIIDQNDTSVTSSSGKNINLQIYDELGYSYTVRLNLKSTDEEGVYALQLNSILDANNEPIELADGEVFSNYLNDGTESTVRRTESVSLDSTAYEWKNDANGANFGVYRKSDGVLICPQSAITNYLDTTKTPTADEEAQLQALAELYGVENISELKDKKIDYVDPGTDADDTADDVKRTVSVLEVLGNANNIAYAGGTANAQTVLNINQATNPSALNSLTANEIVIKGCTVTYNPTTGTFMNAAGKDFVTLNLADIVSKISGTNEEASRFSNVEVDLTTTTMFNNSGSSTIAATSGDKDGLGTGRKLGEMSGISIQQNGMIYASYDNGQTKLLGQIAVAEFSNASGLEKQGDNLYSATLNSGEFDGIGVDITTGGGYMNTGVLEMSNVDLSAEFTEMITTQRGFQANSRIITVSDTLLEELVNLKR